MALSFVPNSSRAGQRFLGVVVGPTGLTGATGATGETGATGPTAGIRQTYSNNPDDGDPGAGAFRLNNTTPSLATAAFLDNADAGGATVSGILDLFDDSTSTVKGILRIEKSADPTVWAQYQVTGSVVDGTGYRKLTLQNGAGSGAFTNGDAFALTFSRTGDKGDTGDTGATGPAGAVGITGTPTTGNLTKFSSATEITNAGAISTDGTFASNSDEKVPTEKAVKTYADGLITALRNGVSATYDTLKEVADWIATTGTAALKNTGTSGNTVPLLDGANTWSAKQTFSNTIELQQAFEKVTTSGGYAIEAGAVYDFLDWGNVVFWNGNASANWTLNVRGNGSNTTNSVMGFTKSLTITTMVQQGATAYYMTGFYIDGGLRTVKWLGQSAPTAGNPNSIDVYTFTIIKTADNTYTIIGTMAKAA